MLASVFEAARRWGYITSIPCRQVTRAKMIEVHPVYFSEDEIRILCNSIKDLDFRDLVLCAFATGMRIGEIVSLQWSKIDIIKKIIKVENTEGFTTKSKKCRVISMDDMVLELLHRQAKNRVCD